MKFANVIVDISHEKLDRPFGYIIPDELEKEITVGTAVTIPFGKGNRQIKGYVIEITDQPSFDISKMKEIMAVEEGAAKVESQLINLAYWIKENYGSTMNQALKTVIPVKNKIRNIEKKTFIYYLIMCLISVSLIRIHLAGNGNIGQVVFLTYYCLTALPLIIIFLKEKNLRNLCMLLCIAISVASTKRTGTIALILGILVMLVLDAHIQGSLREKWKKYMYLFIAICIGSGAVLYLENRSGLEIFDRFSKLSTDGGSGRDIIWAITLQAFKTSNIREKIFGHGFQSVYYRLKPGGFSRFSHNSYIEYLYDYGIIGLSLLVLFVLSLIIIEIKFIREKNKYAPVMGMLLIITIFLSAFSYFFEESNIIQPIAVAYGIILGQAHKERKRYEN